MHSVKLEHENTLMNTSWDGSWRIVLLDLPESRKNERESLRYLLKKAGFVCLKNSAWISPFPLEYLFTNIKKDLGLSTELVIIVTSQIDFKFGVRVELKFAVNQSLGRTILNVSVC